MHQIPGLVYDYAQNPSMGDALLKPCALCAKPTKMAAWVRPEPRRRRGPTAPVCGPCWEDEPETRIRLAIGTEPPRWHRGEFRRLGGTVTGLVSHDGIWGIYKARHVGSVAPAIAAAAAGWWDLNAPDWLNIGMALEASQAATSADERPPTRAGVPAAGDRAAQGRAGGQGGDR